MNNDELIEYAIRTSKAIKEEVKPKLIDYFYKQKEVIDKALDKLYCWGEALNPIFQKKMLDILKEVSE